MDGTAQEGQRSPALGALHDAYRVRRVFGSLDGLRGLSILAVIWHHALDADSKWRLIPGARLGFLGVDLFFVISGFLIVTLLLRERERSGSISLKDFYIRRSLRIYPLYFALVAGLWLLYLPREDLRAVEFRADTPYLLLFVTNWHHVSGFLGVTWSLSAEEQFYFLWPPVERFARRWAYPILALAIGVSQLIHFGVVDAWLERWFGWGPTEPAMLRQTTFMPICLGVLLAHALHHRRAFDLLARVLGHPLAAPLSLLALVALPQAFPEDLTGWPRLTLHLLMTLVLAAAVVREDHPLARFYAFGPLKRIGVVSYGLYLLHHFGLGLAERLEHGTGLQLPLGRFVLGTASAFVLAELSYRLYESRFLALKARFSQTGDAVTHPATT